MTDNFSSVMRYQRFLLASASQKCLDDPSRHFRVLNLSIDHLQECLDGLQDESLEPCIVADKLLTFCSIELSPNTTACCPGSCATLWMNSRGHSVVVLSGDKKVLKSVQCLSSCLTDCVTLPRLLNPRIAPGFCALSSRYLCVIGNDDSGQIASSMEIYDSLTQNWRRGPSVQKPFPRCRLIQIGEGVGFVCGGPSKQVMTISVDSNNVVASCKSNTQIGCTVSDGLVIKYHSQWNSSRDDFSILSFPPLSFQKNDSNDFKETNKDDCGASVLIGTAYVICVGGSDCYGNAVSDVDIYDMDKDVWIKGLQLLRERKKPLCTIAQLNGQPYLMVLGGESKYSETEESVEVISIAHLISKTTTDQKSGWILLATTGLIDILPIHSHEFILNLESHVNQIKESSTELHWQEPQKNSAANPVPCPGEISRSETVSTSCASTDMSVESGCSSFSSLLRSSTHDHQMIKFQNEKVQMENNEFPPVVKKRHSIGCTDLSQPGLLHCGSALPPKRPSPGPVRHSRLNRTPNGSGSRRLSEGIRPLVELFDKDGKIWKDQERKYSIEKDISHMTPLRSGSVSEKRRIFEENERSKTVKKSSKARECRSAKKVDDKTDDPENEKIDLASFPDMKKRPKTKFDALQNWNGKVHTEDCKRISGAINSSETTMRTKFHSSNQQKSDNRRMSAPTGVVLPLYDGCNLDNSTKSTEDSSAHSCPQHSAGDGMNAIASVQMTSVPRIQVQAVLKRQLATSEIVESNREGSISTTASLDATSRPPSALTDTCLATDDSKTYQIKPKNMLVTDECSLQKFRCPFKDVRNLGFPDISTCVVSPMIKAFTDESRRQVEAEMESYRHPEADCMRWYGRSAVLKQLEQATTSQHEELKDHNQFHQRGHSDETSGSVENKQTVEVLEAQKIIQDDNRNVFCRDARMLSGLERVLMRPSSVEYQYNQQPSAENRINSVNMVVNRLETCSINEVFETPLSSPRCDDWFLSPQQTETMSVLNDL